jgi:glycosyltransferase involved in cell wall biosynthesis
MDPSVSEMLAPSVDTSPQTSTVEVVLVGPSLRTWVGGQEVQLDSLARCWTGDSSVQVRLVPNNPKLSPGLAWAERVPLLRTLLRLPVYLTTVWRAAKRADIVHAFSASHPSFLLAPLPACLVGGWLGKRTLVHYHSRLAQQHLQDSAIARWLLRRLDAIVVPSTYLAEIFAQFGLKATVVPNVVDLAQFPYRPRLPLRPLLLCTRNFDHYCGVDDVVRAFRRIKRTIPAARLCLVGKGKEERFIRRLITELHLDDVEFSGAISRERIPERYAKADIFINASRGDNTPVSILEAFASGLPVVTTAAGGIPHMVTHEVTGLLAEVGDCEGLANNALRLLQDPLLAQLLAQNAHEAAKQCRWTAVRTRWLAVYESVQRMELS